MFIKLTMFMGYTANASHTKVVLVNVNHITYITTFTRKFWRYDLPFEERPKEAEELTHTSISFVAGLHEESDSINVVETPEEVMFEIYQSEVARDAN